MNPLYTGKWVDKVMNPGSILRVKFNHVKWRDHVYNMDMVHNEYSFAVTFGTVDGRPNKWLYVFNEQEERLYGYPIEQQRPCYERYERLE